MTNVFRKRNMWTTMLLAALVVCAVFAVLLHFGTSSVKAENGPADGQSTAEITFVSKDKTDLDFMYLSGIILKTDINGASYDRTTNTLTLNNVELSKDDKHYSLTVANMGEDFKIKVLGHNSLDYLSLESIGYDTGCTITGTGILDIGYLDISGDGKKMVVTVDNTVNFNIDSAKMGYTNLPAIKVSSKTPLTAMESMIQVLGATKDELVYVETPSYTNYAYETTTNKLTVTPTRVVKKGTDGKWGYYVNDKLDTSYNGLAGNDFGLWQIKNGLVDFGYNGLTKGTDATYMIIGGKAALDFNGLVPDKDGAWFVEKGTVQSTYVGPVVINGTTYQVDKGQVK